MNSLGTIALILVILLICVSVIAYIQKREQEKAILRQKISQFRYRANQAMGILSNFSQLPIGTEARVILMQYCLANLRSILKLSPHDDLAKKSIESLETSLRNPEAEADKQKLTIPSDFTLLSQQISKLSTLANFILRLNKSNAIQANLAPVAVAKIMALISESKICAYIQQGKDSLSRHDYVPAQRNFIMAQQMMLKIGNKNDRLKQLEVELQELIRSSPIEAMNKHLSFDSPEVSVGEEPAKDDLFGPKKKW